MSRDSARPAQAEMGFEVLEKVICFQGFFRMERYRLRHHKFDGGWSRPITRELLERGHAAAVLPYDPERDRAGAMSAPGGPWLLEIVAGMIDTDESAEQVVTRESVEEAGCHVSDLIPLYDYLVSPGGTTERIALFCGRVDTTGIGGIHGQAEEDEDIKVHVMALAQARALLNSGRIGSASAIIALQWLLLNREIVRQRWLSG